MRVRLRATEDAEALLALRLEALRAHSSALHPTADDRADFAPAAIERKLAEARTYGIWFE